MSSNASGTQAVAAVRFSLGPGESAPILTLAINSKTPIATGAVIACPTASAWSPGDAQAFGTTPAAECASGSVSGVVSDDGTKMAFDLSLFAPVATYSVVLLPTATALPVAIPKPPVAVPVPATDPTIDVTFLPPTSAAVTVLTGVIPTSAPDTVPAPAIESVNAPSPVVATPTTRRAATPTTRRAVTPRRRATATVPLQRISALVLRRDDRARPGVDLRIRPVTPVDVRALATARQRADPALGISSRRPRWRR